MAASLLPLLLISLAVAACSLTVTRSPLFEGLRGWMERRSEWLGELFSCPYCFSHWASAAALWYTAYRLPLDLGVVITWLATIATTKILLRLMVPQ